MLLPFQLNLAAAPQAPKPSGWQALFDAPKATLRAAAEFSSAAPLFAAVVALAPTQLFDVAANAPRRASAFSDAAPAPAVTSASGWDFVSTPQGARPSAAVEFSARVAAAGNIPSPVTPQGWTPLFDSARPVWGRPQALSLDLPRGNVPTAFLPYGWDARLDAATRPARASVDLAPPVAPQAPLAPALAWGGLDSVAGPARRQGAEFAPPFAPLGAVVVVQPVMFGWESRGDAPAKPIRAAGAFAADVAQGAPRFAFGWQAVDLSPRAGFVARPEVSFALTPIGNTPTPFLPQAWGSAFDQGRAAPRFVSIAAGDAIAPAPATLAPVPTWQDAPKAPFRAVPPMAFAPAANLFNTTAWRGWDIEFGRPAPALKSAAADFGARTPPFLIIAPVVVNFGALAPAFDTGPRRRPAASDFAAGQIAGSAVVPQGWASFAPLDARRARPQADLFGAVFPTPPSAVQGWEAIFQAARYRLPPMADNWAGGVSLLALNPAFVTHPHIAGAAFSPVLVGVAAAPGLGGRSTGAALAGQKAVPGLAGGRGDPALKGEFDT